MNNGHVVLKSLIFSVTRSIQFAGSASNVAFIAQTTRTRKAQFLPVVLPLPYIVSEIIQQPGLFRIRYHPVPSNCQLSSSCTTSLFTPPQHFATIPFFSRSGRLQSPLSPLRTLSSYTALPPLAQCISPTFAQALSLPPTFKQRSTTKIQHSSLFSPASTA